VPRRYGEQTILKVTEDETLGASAVPTSALGSLRRTNKGADLTA
jgi:hypothetical protein